MQTAPVRLGTVPTYRIEGLAEEAGLVVTSGLIAVSADGVVLAAKLTPEQSAAYGALMLLEAIAGGVDLPSALAQVGVSPSRVAAMLREVQQSRKPADAVAH